MIQKFPKIKKKKFFPNGNNKRNRPNFQHLPTNKKKEGEGQITVFLEKEKWNDLKNEKNLYFNLDEEKIMFLK